MQEMLRDMDSIPELERFLWSRKWQLQYSCLENPMDKGTWWATVQRVEKNWRGGGDLAQHNNEDKESALMKVLNFSQPHDH